LATLYLLTSYSDSKALDRAIDNTDDKVVSIVCQYHKPDFHHIEKAIERRQKKILDALIRCGGELTPELKNYKEFHNM
jgi:uncharacterized iron-regulated protein